MIQIPECLEKSGFSDGGNFSVNPDDAATLLRASVPTTCLGECLVNNIIYIVGLIVVVIAVLSFFGLR